MSMRIIDADELYRTVTLLWETSDEEDFEKGVFAAIENAPTIEPKTGKWISLDDSRGKYNDYGYKCSECGEHSEYEENYCPNCGCSMKGDSYVDE